MLKPNPQSFIKKDFITITAVTVVLNDVDNIERTINSVLSQKNCELEYIVIDGGSTDGTVDVIRSYAKRISYWESGKDEGIYHAMNKAIEVASGEWVIFINSGDLFCSDNVLQTIGSQIDPENSVIYGQYMVRYPSGLTRKVFPRPLNAMWKGMITSHQALFIRSTLLKKFRFDCSYHIAADYELLFRLFRSGYGFQYLPTVIATISSAGLSDTFRTKVYQEYCDIAGRYKNKMCCKTYYATKIVENYFRMTIKRLMPRRSVEWVLKLK